jgi:hypothetical protein
MRRRERFGPSCSGSNSAPSARPFAAVARSLRSLAPWQKLDQKPSSPPPSLPTVAQSRDSSAHSLPLVARGECASLRVGIRAVPEAARGVSEANVCIGYRIPMDAHGASLGVLASGASQGPKGERESEPFGVSGRSATAHARPLPLSAERNRRATSGKGSFAVAQLAVT